MRRILVLSVLLTVATQAPLAESFGQPLPSKASAIKTIEDLGGEVGIDSELPGEPVWRVDFRSAEITNDTLRILKAFPKLEVLYLDDTHVDDAGTPLIARCTKLTELYLAGTKITDKGLQELSALSNLKQLSLVDTKVTDRGLLHLRGLQQLEPPLIFGTAITQKGLDDWEAARRNGVAAVPDLPNTKPDDRLLRDENQSPEAHRYFAMGQKLFLATRGDPEDSVRAVRLLEKAVELSPTNETYRWSLADAYVHLGNDATTAFATDIYEQLLKDTPNNLRLLSRLSEAYWRLGNSQEALEYALKRLNATPESQIYPAALQAALIALDSNQHDAVVLHLNKTCRRFPRRLEIRLLLATIQIDAGDLNAAEENINMVMNTLPAHHPLAIEAAKIIKRSKP